MYIYLIKNMVNGKVYVGKTETDSVVNRWICHIRGNNCAKVLYRAIVKYGAENFRFYTLYKNAITPGHLNMLEEMYIEMFDANDKRYGYNLTRGGEGISNPSEEIKAKMRKPHKMSKEGSEAIRQAALGNKRASNMSERARRKLGRLMREKRRIWGNKYCSNVFSDKSRKKMRISRKRFLSSLTPAERSEMFSSKKAA